MNYLTGIYGQKTLAGHQHNESKNLAFPSSTYLNLSGGLKPAIRSSDFIEYSPTRLANGSNPEQRKRTIDRLGQAEQRHHQHELALERAGKSGQHAMRKQLRSERLPVVERFLHARHDVQSCRRAGQSQRLRLPTSASRYRRHSPPARKVSRRRRARHLAAAARSQGNANGTSGSGGWFWWGAAGPDYVQATLAAHVQPADDPARLCRRSRWPIFQVCTI